MELVEYWKELKKKTKVLTGVEKVDAGVFHKSGIAGRLGKVAKATPEKQPKLAMAAIKSIDVYRKKTQDEIFKADEKKKTLTDKQMTSMTILDKGLGKIRKQLIAVAKGDNGASTKTNRDVDSDAKYFAVKEAGEAHLQGRKDLAVKSKKWVDTIESELEDVNSLKSQAMKWLAAAKTAKQEKNTMNSMGAIDAIATLLEQAEEIYEKADKRHAEQLRKSSSPFMTLRNDFAKLSSYPPDKAKVYKVESGKHWRIIDAAGKKAEATLKTIRGVVDNIDNIASVSESFSMQGLKPDKYVSKLNKAIEALGKADTNIGRKSKSLINMKNTTETQLKGNQAKEVKIKYLNAQIQAATEASDYLDAQDEVLKSAENVAKYIPPDLKDHFQIDPLLKDIEKKVPGLRTQINDGKKGAVAATKYCKEQIVALG